MSSMLRRRVVLAIIGLALLALFIWFAGPYFAFAEVRPLESVVARLVAIALVVACWAISLLLKRLRAAKASDKLMAGVVKQSARDGGQPSAETLQLRERFEEAIATLKKKSKNGYTLYELPWYVFIGAPGSGKTTALVNSGLKFPLERGIGRGELRGVGGTRNCDWWFTDEAVFLDTAGRYTTQDSDAVADRSGWEEFLTLLRTHRKRRPLNGIILTISAQDLMIQGHGEREVHVAAIRRRLDEISRHLGVQLPVYLMVTKCDLIAGFAEYFDDLPREARAQVWGMTFPYEETIAGAAAHAVPPEFDALVTRLNQRVFDRLEAERDTRRRTRILGFPQQCAGLRQNLSEFVSEVFSTSRFDGQVQLRGVYFTSGTQEGTPIDRLLGAIGRRFAVAPELVAPSSGRGKAYFIERMLKDVILPESGLAGINRRHEIQKAALQVGGYIAVALAAVLGLVALSVSYARNRAYLNDVAAVVANHRPAPVQASASLDAVLPRLNAVAAVDEIANRYRDDTPWLMRWGLFQGRSMGNAARNAYARELGDVLLPRVALLFKERISNIAEPEIMFLYLKAYLMLNDHRHLDREHLEFLTKLEWETTYSSRPDVAALLTKHFSVLLDDDELLRSMPVDPNLVASGRRTIQLASIPRLVYRLLQLNRAADDAGGLRLDTGSGVGADRVLRRESGKSLSEPVPSLYTARVFKEITGDGAQLLKQYEADRWVWGEKDPEAAGSNLVQSVVDVYESDYIRFWDDILDDLDLAPFGNAADALAILTAREGSPLRGFFKTVADQTNLVQAPKPATPASGMMSGLRDKLLSGAKEAAGVPAQAPGSRVTEHFAPIHLLVAGDVGSAPIDRILGDLAEIQKLLMTVGSGAGQTRSVDAIADPRLGQMVKSIQQTATQLQPTLGRVVSQAASRASGTVQAGASGDMANLYRQRVLSKCNEVITGRYPFAFDAKNDVPLDDFGRLFGYGGVFDEFFKTNLQELVDTSRMPWRWRPPFTSAVSLQQFQNAQSLREIFFANGSQKPEVNFTITPPGFGLDASVTRMTVEVDGQVLEYRRGYPAPKQITWPGSPPGGAVVNFETRTGSLPKEFDGAWAWFRLLDAFKVVKETDTRSRVQFDMSGRGGDIYIDSKSINNPFARRDWRQFRCGV